MPALLDAIALQTARLETIKAVLATRLATNSPRRESEAAPLTQEEAAERYELARRHPNAAASEVQSQQLDFKLPDF